MIKKRVFAVLSVILVLVLSVVPVFADPQTSNPSYVLSDDFISSPCPISLIYDFEVVSQGGSHSFSIPTFPFSSFSVAGLVKNNGDTFVKPTVLFLDGMSFSSEIKYGISLFDSKLYDSSSFSGSVSGKLFQPSTTLRDNYSPSSFSSNVSSFSRTSVTISASDFFTFVDPINDQYSQLRFTSPQSTFDSIFNSSQSTYSFLAFPVTDAGLGSPVIYSGNVSDFLNSGSYIFDPGLLLSSSDFYLTDFQLFLPYATTNGDLSSNNVFFATNSFLFEFSFVYSPDFDSPPLLRELPVTDGIFGVFSSVADWFTSFVPNLYTLFWVPGVEGAAGHLTFLGFLAVAGLGISIIFLVLQLILNFLHFRS